MDVGEQEALHDRHAGEADPHRLADDAVRAVGGHHPGGVGVGSVVEAHPDTVAFRFESGNASPPFDVTTEGDQVVAEGGLDVGLGHDQSARTAETGRLPDRETRQFTPVDIDGDGADRQAAIWQVSERAKAVENLDAARLQAQRPRCHRRP